MADLPFNVFFMETQPPKPNGIGTGSPLTVTFKSFLGNGMVYTLSASLYVPFLPMAVSIAAISAAVKAGVLAGGIMASAFFTSIKLAPNNKAEVRSHVRRE